MNDSTLPNPRRSRPASLRPGFALHDWMNLLRRAKDLSGRRGAPLRHDVTLTEVSEHAMTHNGWMVLHGKVYNIAPYLMYHPGGSAILEKCLGKDGTKLFEKYHAWVNIENLIGPLLIGYLSKGERKENEDDDEAKVGAKYLDGGNDDIVLPSTGVAASTSSSSTEFDMPKPRPAKGAEIPSLLGKLDDDEAEHNLL